MLCNDIRIPSFHPLSIAAAKSSVAALRHRMLCNCTQCRTYQNSSSIQDKPNAPLQVKEIKWNKIPSHL